MSYIGISVDEGAGLRVGDRIDMGGRRAVIKEIHWRARGHVLTIAWRDAWYWPILWRIDAVVRDELFQAFLPITIALILIFGYVAYCRTHL